MIIFYMNVGSIPPNEVDAFMQKTISNMKRTPYVDKKTGDYNLKFNMQNMMEDFYIPIRGNDTTTKIDTTKGLDYDGIQEIFPNTSISRSISKTTTKNREQGLWGYRKL